MWLVQGIIWQKVVSSLLMSIGLLPALAQTGPHCLFEPLQTAKREQMAVQSRSGRISTHSVWRIPVVVHVVYAAPEQNLSAEQILSQIGVLNQDYRRTNPDTAQTLPLFKPLAADCEIEFFLAQQDEAGNPTSGITRTATGHGPFGNSDIHQTAKGGKDAWNPSKFLNIWVCNLSSGVKGYGTPPGTALFKDGVVIHYQYFGNTGTAAPYHKGRTATHEVGHFLGLAHLWGVSGNCTDEDSITDTPPQENASVGCSLGRVSCGNQNMVQNFMDYSDDTCMNLFTQGQKAVMRQILQQYRSQLIDTVTIITGIEIAEQSDVLRVYPNPSSSTVFTIAHPPAFAKATLRITDALGRRIKPVNIASHPDRHIITLPCQKGFFLLAFTFNQHLYYYKLLVE